MTQQTSAPTPLTQDVLDVLWDFSDAEASHERLSAAADQASGPERLELLTQVARAVGLQDDFAAAHALLDQVASADPTLQTASVAVRQDLERGRVHLSAGDAATALSMFGRAARVAAAAELTFLQVDALHMLAIADVDRSSEWTEDALDVLADCTDPRTLRWLVSLHNNRGWALADAGRSSEALAEFEASRRAAVSWGTPQQVTWADEAIAEVRGQI